MRRITLLTAAAAAGCAAAARMADGDVAERGAAEAREAHELLAEALGISPVPARIAVYADRGSFVAATGEPDARGLYRDGVVFTYAPVEPRVIRHEVGHHFATALLGGQPPWLAEGIAEVLEGARRIGGRARVPVVAPEHLERLLETGAAFAAPSKSGRKHVDYASSWAAVASLLARGDGTLRERLERLGARRDAAPEALAPSAGELVRLAIGWKGELAELAAADFDPSIRASAARVLGRLGETGALRAAWETERWFPVQLAIAGALARNGEREALKALAPAVRCLHALAQVSRSAGRDFGTAEALRDWVR
jgi:hypothetical protein